MSQKGLDKLYNLDKFDAKGSNFDFHNELQYIKQVKNSYCYGVSRMTNFLR